MMKRLDVYYMTLFLFLFIGDSLLANGIVSKGFKIGLNVSNIRYESDYTKSPKIGFALGGFLNYKINDQLSVQTNMIYSMKGSSTELTFTDNEGSTTLIDRKNYNLNFIEIPIVGFFSFRNKISVFSGPYIGFFLNGTYESKIDGNLDLNNDNVNVNAGPEIGLWLGINYNVDKIDLILQYSFAFTSTMITFDDSEYYDAKSFDNRVLQFLIGYSL